MDIVTWGNVAFYVKENEIKSFRDFTLSASAVTEDNTEGTEKYVKLKNRGAYTVGLTAVLHQALNVDVKKIAIELAEAARQGRTGYLYCGGQKLLTPMMMLTDAKISNVSINSKGVWQSCEAALTLKQCSKGGGEGSGSGGGSGGNGNGGEQEFRVQISGMSELKIKAKSTQQAIKRAVHSVYTGYIMVNGISYYVIHGIIADDKAMGVQQNQDDEKQAKHDSRSQAQKIYDKAHEFLKQLLPNYFGNE